MPDEKNRLPELARDLMTVGVRTCSPRMPLGDLARLLLEEDLESVVVLGQEGHAVGVVGRDEVIAAYARYGVSGLAVEDVMCAAIPQIPPDLPLTAAAQLMRDKKVRALYLLHHGGGIEYPSAVISYKHLLRLVAARSADDLRDLGARAERETPLEAFRRKAEAGQRAARHGNRE